MGKTNYTPGPWRRERRAATDAILSPNGEVIAEVYGRSAGRSDECEANARLIAAAPDLLAAVRSMIDADVNGSDDMRYVARRAVMAAVRAAEGE